MREIVGAKIGSIITNIPSKIFDAVEKGRIRKFLSKKEMQFMSNCDLGKKWDDMAKSPVLFVIDDENEKVYPPDHLSKELEE
jgi:hypothetical protein